MTLRHSFYDSKELACLPWLQSIDRTTAWIRFGWLIVNAIYLLKGIDTLKNLCLGTHSKLANTTRRTTNFD